MKDFSAMTIAISVSDARIGTESVLFFDLVYDSLINDLLISAVLLDAFVVVCINSFCVYESFLLSTFASVRDKLMTVKHCAIKPGFFTCSVCVCVCVCVCERERERERERQFMPLSVVAFFSFY
jgi:hypothetical protein